MAKAAGRGRRAVAPPRAPSPSPATPIPLEVCKEVLQSLPVGVCLLRREADRVVVVASNARATEAFGGGAGEASPRTVEAAFEGFRSPALVDAARRAATGSARVEVGEVSWRGTEGQESWFEATALPLSDGFAAVTFEDVTARRRATEAARESERWLQRAQHVAHIGHWASGLGDDDRLEWSRETHRIFGVSEGEFDGTVESFFRRVHPDDMGKVRESLAAALRGESPYSVEHRIVRPDGSTRWVHGRAVVVRDAAARPTRLLGTVQDVTERRALEEQLRQAQKMEAVGRLAGGIAHDFNNLLTTVLGYAHLLLARLDADAPERTYADQIRRAGERASGLTGQMLAFSRRQHLSPRTFDVNERLRDLERMLSRLIPEDVRLVAALGDGVGSVRADPVQFDQVILNLVVNARDAMPRGGTVTLRTDVVPVDDAASDRGGLHVRVSVADTGVGMDERTRAHLFEPFFTTKPPGKGTGLGLATAYGIVRQSEGHVTVESEPGCGSTFHVLLPRVEPDADLAAPQAPAAPPRAAHRTVLLVEDEVAVREMTREVLSDHGYRVLVAADGVEAYEAATGHAGSIDLLLTDVVMPRMGGVELAERVRAARPATRVLFMSGYTEPAQRAGMDPADPVLSKPFHPHDLLTRVEQVLQA